MKIKEGKLFIRLNKLGKKIVVCGELNKDYEVISYLWDEELNLYCYTIISYGCTQRVTNRCIQDILIKEG